MAKIVTSGRDELLAVLYLEIGHSAISSINPPGVTIA